MQSKPSAPAARIMEAGSMKNPRLVNRFCLPEHL
jgi:hypothetical protein